MNNNSEKKETFDLFKKYQNKYSNFRVIDANYEFNYSKINNQAVEAAKGEYIVLLNIIALFAGEQAPVLFCDMLCGISHICRRSSGSAPCAFPFCCRMVPRMALTAGGASAAGLDRRRPAAWQCGMKGATGRRPRRGRARCRTARGLRAWRAEVRSGRKVTRSGAFGRRSRAKAHAARAGAKPCGTHSAISTILQQRPFFNDWQISPGYGIYAPLSGLEP